MSRQARVLAVVRSLGLPFGVYALLALALIAPAISLPGASVPGSEGTDTFNGLWSFWFFGESPSDGRLPW